MIGADAGQSPPLPMEGALPPDLEGTLVRVGPGDGAPGSLPGALHAVELREGRAVSYLRQDSPADAGVFWHAGALLALPEAGVPVQYSRTLEREEFSGGLTVPVASHVHRVAADGARALFAVDDRAASEGGAAGDEGVFLRLGEWDAQGSLRHAQSVALERATWQHDVGVTASQVVFIESPTERLPPMPAVGVSSGADGADDAGPDGMPVPVPPRVPFGWLPGADGWVGVVPRGGDGSSARWFRVDPCLVTHVMGAWETEEGEGGGDRHGPQGGGADIVLYVCRYPAPEAGRPIERGVSVVGDGIGLSPIGGGLPVLERWALSGDHLERTQIDDRHAEYPRIDSLCEGAKFRYGYAVELGWGRHVTEGREIDPARMSPRGLLKFDLSRDESAAWQPGPGATPSEPLFVRAADGRNDEEGWLLCLVDDVQRDATDLVVLDASSFGRRRPEAVIHLPARLPLRAHGEWVPAERYR